MEVETPTLSNLDVSSVLASSHSLKIDSNVIEDHDCIFTAALKVQKVYRSYRTRRRLADSAVVAEELWWQAMDYVRLNHSTVSFFNFEKPESIASRWNRVSLNASKIGKGLSKDSKARKLAFQHWIEAIDPRHRYGHSLHLYYEKWCESDSGQPFFYWLDLGDGKDCNLKECPRTLLRQQCIKYMGPKERESYEYLPVDGTLVHKQTGELMDTTFGSKGGKWIFVMSTSKKFYAGQKKKGAFHHSSFLAGGTTVAAGRLIVENGVLKAIWAYSGHYHPTDENLECLLNFLRDNGINLDQVEVRSSVYEDYDNHHEPKSNPDIEASSLSSDSAPLTVEIPSTEPVEVSQLADSSILEAKFNYKRTLSDGNKSPRVDVPRKAILERIHSKKAVHSYQLGCQLSLKWSSGVGPRIGCIADYPIELRTQALEMVSLSPRNSFPSKSDDLGFNFSPQFSYGNGHA